MLGSDNPKNRMASTITLITNEGNVMNWPTSIAIGFVWASVVLMGVFVSAEAGVLTALVAMIPTVIIVMVGSLD